MTETRRTKEELAAAAVGHLDLSGVVQDVHLALPQIPQHYICPAPVPHTSALSSQTYDTHLGRLV